MRTRPSLESSANSQDEPYNKKKHLHGDKKYYILLLPNSEGTQWDGAGTASSEQPAQHIQQQLDARTDFRVISLCLGLYVLADLLYNKLNCTSCGLTGHSCSRPLLY